MILVNYPYPSGAHLNDIVVVVPFHYRGEIHGYFGNLAHHVDVGGGAPASMGAFREIYQEGVIIPPVRMVKAGKSSATCSGWCSPRSAPSARRRATSTPSSQPTTPASGA